MAVIIGLGHRARQGKDYVANYLKEMLPHTYIVHWADKLYEEIKNEDSIFPLITYNALGNFYHILDKSNSEISATYTCIVAEEVPMLDKIFKERNIDFYDKMLEKDSPMLQFWGTDFRRRFFGNNYWVNHGIQKIKEIVRNDYQAIILIPDTRFLNELMAIQDFGGYYVDVIRYHEDGSRYYSTDRDQNHQSECELDGANADYVIKAKSGDLDSLYKQISNIYNDIASKNPRYGDSICREEDD